MLPSYVFALCSIENGSDFAPWKTREGVLDETLTKEQVCSSSCKRNEHYVSTCIFAPWKKRRVISLFGRIDN